ncbi:MAG: N-acetylmuramoyl-L-alanine amidase [Verrucomicrobiota bacterium]
MRARFSSFIFACGWLSVATLAVALPSQQDMVDRLHKDEARSRTRATPTPTATRTVAPSSNYRSTRDTSEPASGGSRPSTVVVIDAGHGGFDRGGIAGQRVSEKMMTLDVAQRLRTILNANGYRTVMTRDSDVFIPLGTRVAIANSYRNGIFVCIHFNSASRRGANGIETYFYSSQSLPLASAIHYYVAHAAPSSNRGVRRRGYYVLRRTTVPAVLVECGFLTNPTEAQYAQSATYRQSLAEQIARGVRSRTTVASNESVPLQPFIDQTRVHDPDISGSKHRSKKASSKKKGTTVHKKEKSSSDESSGTPSKKKKPATKKSED